MTSIAKRHQDTTLNLINQSVFGYRDNEVNRNAFHQWIKSEKITPIMQKPEGKKYGENRTDPGVHRWFVPAIRSGFALDSTLVRFGEVLSIFLMQR